MRPKKIAIDARNANREIVSGGGIYLKSLLSAMAAIDKTNEYVLYLDSEINDSFPLKQANFKTKVIRSSVGWTQLGLPRALAFDSPDVYFSPHHWLPLLMLNFEKVITIHDLAFLKYPQYFGWKTASYFKLNTFHAIYRADKIITISEASKKDIIEHYGIAEDKIKVIHLGYDPIFDAPLEPERTKSIRAKYGIDKDYLFFLGNLHLRKNLTRIISAFERLKANGDINHKLVITGQKDFLTDRINQLIKDSKVRNDIILTGYVERSEVPYLMGNASIFLFPSLFEGFGIPILEAMAAGTPVITSNVTSMPEIAGDAAKLVNPFDVQEISAAIQEVLTNSALRAALVEKGRRRRQLFSWEKTANETIDFICSA